MIERTLVMSFKDAGGKTVKINLKDVKENFEELDVTKLMNGIVDNGLVVTAAGPLAEVFEAEVVTKETAAVTVK